MKLCATKKARGNAIATGFSSVSRGLKSIVGSWFSNKITEARFTATTALDVEQELPDSLENNSSIDENTGRWNDKEKEPELKGSYLLES